MTSPALTLVLLAAVLHAAWNVLAKRAKTDVTAFVWLCSALSFAIYLPVVALTGFLHPARFDTLAFAFVIGTGSIHLAYFTLLQRGYRVGDMSLVYPVARGTGPLLASIGAVAFFGERPDRFGLIGIACIIAGIFLAAGGRHVSETLHARASLAYGLATGAAIAAYTLWDKHAVGALALSPILYDFGRNVVQMVLMAPWAAHDRGVRVRQAWKDARAEAFGVAILSPIAYVLVLFALVHAPVSLVAPAREISIVFGTILGARLFGEGFAVRRAIAALLMFAGIVAIARG